MHSERLAKSSSLSEKMLQKISAHWAARFKNLSTIICCVHWLNMLEHTLHGNDAKNYIPIMMVRVRLG